MAARLFGVHAAAGRGALALAVLAPAARGRGDHRLAFRGDDADAHRDEAHREPDDGEKKEEHSGRVVEQRVMSSFGIGAAEP
jgi:hypothetical protein